MFCQREVMILVNSAYSLSGITELKIMNMFIILRMYYQLDFQLVCTRLRAYQQYAEGASLCTHTSIKYYFSKT